MNAKPILDPMAVLAANKGQDKNGIIKLADKTWLDNSIFKKVRMRRSCDYKDFLIRKGYGFYEDFDKAGKRIPCWEDPDKVFYFSGDSTVPRGENKPISFYSDPLNGCGVTVKTSWLNLYYLIDMATDILAKEINKIPTHDQAGKHYSKKERLNLFHDAIEGRIQYFIIDELPRTVVGLLGHELLEIIKLMQKELQTIYQLMFLLTDNKAGVGNGCFMWHVNPERLQRSFFNLPYSDAYADEGVSFAFPLADCFMLDYEDDYLQWLNEDNTADQESIGSLDYYLLRNLSELLEANKIILFRVDCCWQYLSIGQHRLSIAEIMQDVLTYGLKTFIWEGSFARRYFAEEVAKKGVASVNWEGIFYPYV